MANATKKVGRKPQYAQWLTQKGLDQIEEWSCSGLFQQDIAKLCGVSVRSFYEWMEKYPQLLQAVKKGRGVADDTVENSLFKNAIGYDYEEEIPVKNKIARKLEGKIVYDEVWDVISVKKHKTAETTAQIFWLKNRQPTHWSDKQDVTLNGEVNVTPSPSFTETFVEMMKKRHEETDKQ